MPRELETEWRLVAVRSLAIAFMLPCLGWLPLSPAVQSAALVVLASAFVYNAAIRVMLPHFRQVFSRGYLTTLGDGLLNVAMVTLGGGFDGPLYALLYTVTISTAMRYGYGLTGMVAAGLVGCDLVERLFQAEALDAVFLVRSGFLLLTALLASYLRAQTRRAEASLARQLLQTRHDSLHDRLTGLPNRRFLADYVDELLALGPSSAVALLLVNVDHFAAINDMFGYDYADRVLQRIGSMIRSTVPQTALLARIPGDTFGIALPCASGTAPSDIAAAILRELETPLQVDAITLDISVSIGIAMAPEDGAYAQELFRHAASAVRQAKRRRGDFARYMPSGDQHTPERVSLAVDLRRAVERGELRLVYQPIVAVESGHIQEVEALVRWAHPTRGMVPPGEFIALAEETGVIGSIGRWVLGEACRQAQAWRTELPEAASLVVSVNLSARQMEHDGLVEEVGALLAASGLEPSALKLEITESAAMADVERSIAMLWMLKGLGVRLAIDDFGTGYSSLGYIKRIPADTLKVDKVFVDGLGIHAEDRAIIAAIIAFARSVGMTTTVEGVEDADQFALIRELQADRVQGFYCSRPLAAVDIPAVLTASRRPPHELAPRAAGRTLAAAA